MAEAKDGFRSGPSMGAARTTATAKHIPATASMNNCCTRTGCLGTRMRQYTPITTIKRGGRKSMKSSQCVRGKGRSQSARNKVVATDATTIMLVYSARKYSDQRKPLNSVMYPATNSDSASGKSNGARFVSAMEATKYTKNATGASNPNQMP